MEQNVSGTSGPSRKSDRGGRRIEDLSGHNTESAKDLACEITAAKISLDYPISLFSSNECVEVHVVNKNHSTSTCKVLERAGTLFYLYPVHMGF